MADENVGSVSLGVDLDKTRLKKSLLGLEKQTSGGLSRAYSGSGIAGSLAKIGALAAGAFAIGSMVRFSASAIKLGSDLAEVQNVVDVTFGSMSGQINAFAQSAMTSYGLSETAAKKYTGTMGAMLKSMGLSVDAAADMSIAMAGLAGDFASFYNLDTDEAFAKIRAGISGETEPLKQLGINMSVANLEAFALSQGITASYNSLNQASQALLRYNYLMSVTSDAQGDFARTAGSWANQTRVLKLQWDSFKASFGQGLINLFTPILVGINRIMAGLIKLGQMFSMITGALFGTQKAASGLGSAMAAVANSGGSAAEGQSQLAKATKAAGKAAGGALGSFDKLNVLQAASSDAGDSGGAGAFAMPTLGGAMAGESDSGYYTPKINEATIFMTKLKGLFNFDNIKQSWANLKTALTPLGENIWAGLKWAWDNILVPFGQWTVNTVVPGFLDALAGAAGVLNSALEVLKPLGSWLWEKMLKPMAEYAGSRIGEEFAKLRAGLDSVSGWIGAHQKTVETIAIVVGSFAAAWGLVTVAMGLFGIVAGGIGAVMAVVTSPIFLITLAIGALIAAGVLLYRNWDTVKAFMINMWTAVKGAWSSAVSWFRGIFTAIGTAFSNVWTGIKNMFISVLNFMIRGLNKFINNFLKPFNAIIEGLNLVPGVNIPKLKIEIPTIPALAEGGIVSQPTLAMVGDNKRSAEVVAPLHKLQGMMGTGDDAVLKEIARGQGEIIRLMRAMKFPSEIKMDGKPVASVLMDYLLYEARRRGIPWPVTG